MHTQTNLKTLEEGGYMQDRFLRECLCRFIENYFFFFLKNENYLIGLGK
jgi:hypothetical protein